MRIANKTIYDSVIQRLGTVSTEMLEASEVVSTAKRINNLSDDPVGLVTVLDLRSSLANIEQIERNIQVGKTWLSSGETALTQMESLITSTKELVIQMSSSTVSSAARENSVEFVDGYLRQILSLANSEVGGRYIFGGTNTETTPFAFNEDETEVGYSGNDTPFSIKIGKNNNMDIGRDGRNIFGKNWDEKNFFKTFIDLKTHLQNNDEAEIKATLDKLDSHLDKLKETISDIGGKTNRVEVKQKIVQELEIAYKDRKAFIEEADITEAIMILKSKEMAYNATLSASSRIMRQSLADFL